MGSKSDPPNAPDYRGAAEEQSRGALDLARINTKANRVNYSTPFGSLNYTNGQRIDQAGYDKALSDYQAALQAPQTPQYYPDYYSASANNGDGGYLPGGPTGSVQQSLSAPNIADFTTGDPDQWSAQVTLDPTQQALLDADNQTRQRMSGMQGRALDSVDQAMATPFSFSGAPAAGAAYTPQDTGSGYGSDAYSLMMERLSPQLQQKEEATRNRLANQGLTAGSEGWGTELDQLGRDQNDQRIAAALSSFDLGMKKDTLGMGQQAQQFGQQNTLRDKYVQEELLKRRQPFDELASLRSGSQYTMPTFGTSPTQPNVSPPNYLGAATNQYEGAMNSFNAEQGQDAQTQQGLASLASMAMMMFAFSDVSIKRDIRRVATADNGLGIYRYYNLMTQRPEVGLLAQEVEIFRPGAVRRHPNGLLQVNYAAALE